MRLIVAVMGRIGDGAPDVPIRGYERRKLTPRAGGPSRKGPFSQRPTRAAARGHRTCRNPRCRAARRVSQRAPEAVSAPGREPQRLQRLVRRVHPPQHRAPGPAGPAGGARRAYM